MTPITPRLWVDDAGNEAVVELGPRDMVRTPAGQAHFIRNPGAGAATLWTVIGQSDDDDFTFQAG